MTKKILSTLCGFLSTFMLFGQLPLKADGFTRNISNPKTISVCDTSDLGFLFPLNDVIKKYDKYSAQLMARKIGENEGFKEVSKSYYIVLVDFPTSKAFMDSNEGKKEISVLIKGSPTNRSNSTFYETDFCNTLENANYYTSYEYKVVIKGYFETGSETYWDEYSETIKTRTLYEFSKEVYSTVPFSFVKTSDDQIKLEENAAKEALLKKRWEDYLEISKKYELEVEVPFVGITQPRIHIYTAYKLLRAELIESNDYETLDKVDAKLLSISSNFKTLNKTLKGETNTKVILDEILQFPY